MHAQESPVRAGGEWALLHRGLRAPPRAGMVPCAHRPELRKGWSTRMPRYSLCSVCDPGYQISCSLHSWPWALSSDE